MFANVCNGHPAGLPRLPQAPGTHTRCGSRGTLCCALAHAVRWGKQVQMALQISAVACKCLQMFANVRRLLANVCQCLPIIAGYMRLFASGCKCLQMSVNVCKCLQLSAVLLQTLTICMGYGEHTPGTSPWRPPRNTTTLFSAHLAPRSSGTSTTTPTLSFAQR